MHQVDRAEGWVEGKPDGTISSRCIDVGVMAPRYKQFHGSVWDVSRRPRVRIARCEMDRKCDGQQRQRMKAGRGGAWRSGARPALDPVVAAKPDGGGVGAGTETGNSAADRHRDRGGPKRGGCLIRQEVAWRQFWLLAVFSRLSFLLPTCPTIISTPTATFPTLFLSFTTIIFSHPGWGRC